MSRNHLRLTVVQALPEHRLRLRYADGMEATVDLSTLIAHSKALAPLRNAELFARARHADAGAAVQWIDDDLSMGADNLRHLAIEQAGGIGHERIWEWMHRNGLTQECAADAIGISRRMLNYYRNGERPIPKTVWLACVGYESSLAPMRRRLHAA